MALDQLKELMNASRGAVQTVEEPVRVGLSDKVQLSISLDCSHISSTPNGIRLNARERFFVLVSSNFPFEIPQIVVPHRRWAGSPHVQFGSQVCLYAAPNIEWDPSDGIFGLIERLTIWLDRAAIGELDPDDQPLHPPVAYITGSNGSIVIRANLGDLAPPPKVVSRGTSNATIEDPKDSQSFRLVVGIAENFGGGRLDVVEWTSRDELRRRFVRNEIAPVQNDHSTTIVLAALLEREMSFEYPNQVSDLVSALEHMGVPRSELFRAVGEVGAMNDLLGTRRADESSLEPEEFLLLIGTPSRRLDDGHLRQHLVCWRFDEIGRRLAENIVHTTGGDALWARVAEVVEELLPLWVESAAASWVRVMEARDEVTVRRDHSSAAAWVKSKKVLILGCGALGSPIAEYCVRAGANIVRVLDDELVTPGILVRQPFNFEDITRPKAMALADRLNRLTSLPTTIPMFGSAEMMFSDVDETILDMDLIVDATADSSVASFLELQRARSDAKWPPLLTVMVGHEARRGVVTISKPEASGASRDIMRKLALDSFGYMSAKLFDVAEDFFPGQHRASFQPEPGCSSPTFTGSSAELAALSGRLCDAGMQALIGGTNDQRSQPMVATIVRLDSSASDTTLPPVTSLGWANDHVETDLECGFEVRLSPSALTEIRTEVRRGARIRGHCVETGGMLFGHYDSACRCVWIDAAAGPAPDSKLSSAYFLNGIEGAEDLVQYYRDRSRGLSAFIGNWHSHPYGPADPSPTDEAAMVELVFPFAKGLPRGVILIVGGLADTWSSWRDEAGTAQIFARVVARRTESAPSTNNVVSLHPLEKSWPGGWHSGTPSFTTMRRSRRRLGRFFSRRKP